MADDIWEHYGKEYQAAEARTWQPVRPGVPYTCQTCPALIEARAELERWKLVAERLYNADPHDPAAMQYAYMAYEEARDAIQP